MKRRVIAGMLSLFMTVGLVGQSAFADVRKETQETEISAETTLDHGDTSSGTSWGTEKSGVDLYYPYVVECMTNPSVTVAVLDTGVDMTHEGLASSIAAGGYDFVDNDNDPSDESGSGTGVAGIIKDCTNGLDVRILPIRIVDTMGVSTNQRIAEGVRYAVEKGAQVIHLNADRMRLVDDALSAIEEAIYGHGCSVVIPAGDDGVYQYNSAGNCWNFVSVSACDEHGDLADFSNKGNITIAAPGVDVWTCARGGGYIEMSGTDMAAAHVAAIAAMRKLEDSNADIYDTLKRSARDVGAPGADSEYGFGLLDMRVWLAIGEDSFYWITYHCGDEGLITVHKKLPGNTYILDEWIPNLFPGKFVGWSVSRECDSVDYYPGDIYTEDKDLHMFAVISYPEAVEPGSLPFETFVDANLMRYGKTFSFTPTKNGTYVFQTTGLADTQGYLYTEDGTCIAEDGDSGARSNFRMEVKLTAKQTYYLDMYNYNPIEKECLVQVYNKASQEVNTTYHFHDGTSLTTTTAYGLCQRVFRDHSFEFDSQFLGWSVNEGDSTIALKGRDLLYTTNTQDLYSVWGDLRTVTNVPKTIPCFLYSEYRMDRIKIIPPASGYYIMESTDVRPACASLWDKNGNLLNEDIGEVGFKIRQYLQEGDEYYLHSYLSGDVLGSYAIRISREDAQSYNQKLTNGVPIHDECVSDGSTAYEFTAPAAGTYAFFTTGDGDPLGILYGDYRNLLDDNSGEDYNFYMEWDLAAGEMVVIVVGAGERLYQSEYDLYACRKYTVKYNANGGSGQPDAQTKYHGIATVLSSDVPTRSGYKFLGWATSKTATAAKYAAGAKFSSNANTTLYAVWEEIPTITDLISGKVVSGTLTAGKHRLYRFTAPADATYIFTSTGDTDTLGRLYSDEAYTNRVAVNDNSGDGNNFRVSYAMKAGDTIYLKVSGADSKVAGSYKVIAGKKYTISYDANGGIGAPEQQIKVQGLGIKLSDFPPTKMGYQFLGWAKSKTAAVPDYAAGASYGTNANLKLYAVWKAPAVELTAGKLVSATIAGAPNLYSFTAPADAAYIFTTTGSMDTQGLLCSDEAMTDRLAYNDNSGDGNNFKITYTMTAGQTVYLKVSGASAAATGSYKMLAGKKYTITYNANGGTGAPSAQAKVQGLSIKLSETEPAKSGSRFLGWAKSKTAAVPDYAAGASYGTNANLTLYAVWETPAVELTAGKLVSATIAGTTNLYSFTAPADAAYIFTTTGSMDTQGLLCSDEAMTDKLAYNDNSGDGNNFKITYTMTAGQTVYLKVSGASAAATGSYKMLAGKKYTITYNATGGTGAPSAQAKVQGLSIKLSETVPAKAGYTFLGWAKSKTAAVPDYAAGASYSTNANLTLYAIWQK